MNRDSSGQFKRLREKPWDGTDWNDGYVDNKGRFRVYRPDYPRAYPEGYALRYHVVWWLTTGKVHPKGTNLHHINEIKSDDRFENLQLMGHGEHTIHHCKKPGVELICKFCNEVFRIPAWRIAQRKREEGYEPAFCSQSCYHKAGGRWRKAREN